MNKSFSASSRMAGFATWMAVVLTLGQLGWLQSRTESGLRLLFTRVTDPSTRDQARLPYEDCDRMAARAGQGNVFLELAGCAGTNFIASPAGSFFDYHDYFLSVWYYRTSYDLYPRRVYLAPSDMVINGGRDMMRVSFVPDPTWLQAHNVRSVLTVGFDNLGRTLPPRLEHIKTLNTGDRAPTGGTGGN